MSGKPFPDFYDIGGGNSTWIGPLVDRDGAGSTILIPAEINQTMILIDSSTSIQTVTLPVVGIAEDGFEFDLKREGSNNVIINPGAGSTLHGLSSVTISVDKNSLRLKYHHASTDWKIV